MARPSLLTFRWIASSLANHFCPDNAAVGRAAGGNCRSLIPHFIG
jgi:hypothetical protein